MLLPVLFFVLMAVTGTPAGAAGTGQQAMAIYFGTVLLCSGVLQIYSAGLYRLQVWARRSFATVLLMTYSIQAAEVFGAAIYCMRSERAWRLLMHSGVEGLLVLELVTGVLIVVAARTISRTLRKAASLELFA